MDSHAIQYLDSYSDKLDEFQEISSIGRICTHIEDICIYIVFMSSWYLINMVSIKQVLENWHTIGSTVPLLYQGVSACAHIKCTEI